jgi:hypothetical protein
MFYFPDEILAHIASFLKDDIFILKLYSALPEYKNSYYLPELKNNYNYFDKDYKTAEKIIEYGFKIKIVSNFASIGLLLNNKNINNIISLKLYIKKNTKILRNNFNRFVNLKQLILPNCCIDFNIKKLPKSLIIYKYNDRNEIINPQKYNKYGIKCINLYYNYIKKE